MADGYRIIGAEMCLLVIRSYFRYKDIPHQWIPRNRDRQAGSRPDPRAAGCLAGLRT